MLKKKYLLLFLTFNIPNIFGEMQLGPGESFLELGLFQEYMTQYSSPCWHSCDSIVNNGSCSSQPFRGMSSCDGHSFNCEWLGTTDACVSVTGKHRIRWASGRDNLFYGQKDRSCPTEEQFRVIGTAPDPLGVCHCTCYKKKFAIYVGEMRSRENESYVITDIRFAIQNNVLYLQPAEAKLGASSDFSWITLPKNPSELHWVTLENRNFFLDQLILDEGQVLTGIKFEYMETQKPKIIKGFAINIRGVRHDATNNVLDISPMHTQILKPSPHIERYPVDGPIHDFKQQKISARSDAYWAYATLERSSLEQDFGQTTTPLFYNSKSKGKYKPLVGFELYVIWGTVDIPYFELTCYIERKRKP